MAIPRWVQQMMGHESLTMIHAKYYSHIRNYRRESGGAFMDNVFNSWVKIDEGNGQVLTEKISESAPKGLQPQLPFITKQIF
jgi:hypothetical protein